MPRYRRALLLLRCRSTQRGSPADPLSALLLILWQQRLMDLVGQGVTTGFEPLATPARVVPPLPLHSSYVPLIECVGDKGLGIGLRRRSLPDFSAKAKFVDASLAAVWTLQQKRHRLYLPKTLRVPAKGTPQMIDASMVKAAMSSGSRWCTSDLPQARANIWISRVMARSRFNARSAPCSISSRFISSGSCVVMPTGQRPVWQ